MNRNRPKSETQVNSPSALAAPTPHEQLILTEIQRGQPFQGLSLECYRKIARHSQISNLQRGDLIWHQDNPAQFCLVVLDGAVQMHRSSSEGQEQIHGIFGPGDLLGVIENLTGRPYPSQASLATRSGRILRMNLGKVRQELQSDCKMLAQNWIEHALHRYESVLTGKIEIMGAGRVEGKLNLFFNNLSVRFGRKEANSVHIPISLTKTQIARAISVRVETVIKELNRWERNNRLKMTTSEMIVTLPDPEFSLPQKGPRSS